MATKVLDLTKLTQTVSAAWIAEKLGKVGDISERQCMCSEKWILFISFYSPCIAEISYFHVLESMPKNDFLSQ